ncbi:hypothetical protein LVD17_02805 [Fulvivirga ulvae]|uniref:transporter n=1 Tax=Fulvivirga ulvae TaxID=2904245 RepID=UPI001F35FC0A|nr:transporter [Fulvivirga ulvae]UII32761.1 hypothetical protein LVD17_02805 [Fulvivirga ulvae]
MKKILIILLCAIGHQVAACDVCGCKLGGLYFGILPQFESHFIGLRYSHAAFNATIKYNSEYLDDEFSDDTYQRIELLGKYAISPKWQINAVVPYMMNKMDGSHQKVEASGMGDPVILLYYNAFNNSENMARNLKHVLLLGGGLKLPLGKYDQDDQGEIINRNFQLGSGSVDYIVSLNYTARLNKIGVNLESSYKMNTANKDDYRFGNQFNMSGYLFYSLEKPLFSVLPFGGVFYEQAAMHEHGKIDEINTGGDAYFATAGVQLYRGKFNVLAQYQIPVSQSYNVDKTATIEAGNRLTLSAIFSIRSKNN